MEDIRKGNDINVSWSVVSNGEPFVLEGLDVSLYLKNTFERKAVSDFVLKGSKVIWTFLGKDQKHTGKHSLELVIKEGKRGMITTDACNFVNLVNCSCKIGGVPEPNVEIQSIELTSNLQYVAGASRDELNEILSAACSLDFNTDFNNDFTTGF